jgi:radical SAM-linked protein
MAYSQGFNPHPILSFAQALGVGLDTKGDYFAVGLTADMTPEALVEAFNHHAPQGLTALFARAMAPEEKTPMANVAAARYRIEADDAQALRSAAETLLKGGAPEMLGKIFKIESDRGGTTFLVSCGNENLSLKALTAALCEVSALSANRLRRWREDLLMRTPAGDLVPLSQARP